MKKLTLMISLFLIVFGLTACNSAPAEEDKITIGLSMNDMSNPFISFVGSGIEELALAAGYDVQIADAASNVQTQISQLENFITMEVDAVFVFATDPVALGDTTQKIADAGIKLVTAGGDLQGANVVMNVDQYEWGQTTAGLLEDWAKEALGETSGKVIVIKSTSTSESTKRSQGLIDGATQAGFEVVVAETEAIAAADARTVMENMWQKNSDAIAVLTYAADGAIGVNEFIMGINSVDKAKFGVFSCDTSDAIVELINQSSSNESVFRGTVGIGGPTIDGTTVGLPEGTFTIIDRLIKGEDTGYTGDSVVAILPK